MAKKRPRTVTFGEMTAELPHVVSGRAGPGIVGPPAKRGFLDAEGREWTRTRGPIDPRRAKRLAVTADLMSIEDGLDGACEARIPVYLPEGDRQAAWLEIKPRLGAPYIPGRDVSYDAYEFTSVDGLTLVHFDVHC